MKKIYIAPQNRIRVMDAECICTSSIDVQIFHDSEGVGGDEAQGREQRESNRNSSIWDQGW
jgi:hypothetical protein